MSFAVRDFIFQFSLFQNFPPTAFFAAVQTSTEALHVSNRACLGLWWCRFPTWPPKPHTGANLLFLPRTGLPLPLKGEGLGIVFLDSLGFPRREARCFSAGKDGYFVSEGFSRQLPWQLLATTGSHGPNRAGLLLCWCLSPIWPPKPHTGPHRAKFWFFSAERAYPSP